MRPAQFPHAGWIALVLLAALTLGTAAPPASADHPRSKATHRSSGLSITFQTGSTFRGGLHHRHDRHVRHHSLTRSRLGHPHRGLLHSRPLSHRRLSLRHHRPLRPLHHRPLHQPPIVLHPPLTRRVHRSAIIHRPNTVVVVRPSHTRTVHSTTRLRTAPSTTTVITHTEVDGWAYLHGEEYDPRAAIDAFAGQAERYPHQGLPRVGYALSQAMAGNDDKAAWAMRRAVEREPESLGEVAIDRHLRGRLDELADRYDRRIREGFTRTDDLFMLAAVRYIQGESAAAFPVIEAAVEQGDTEPSTRQLKQLIDREFEDPE